MPTIRLNKNAPIVIVDCSYFVFYRLFASQKWWAFANKDAPAAPRLDNPVFCDAFKKHMAADIQKLMKKWGLVKGRGKNKIMAPENMIFAKDCRREDIWRMELFPAYKGARQVNKAFDPAAFPICLQELDAMTCPPTQQTGDLPTQTGDLPQTGPQIVSHPKLEADDVAALLFKQIRAAHPTHPITFITGDHDYLQLKDDATQIFAMPDKNLYEAGVKKGTHDLQRKIIKGDVSDNIAPVLKSKKHIDAYMAATPDEREAILRKLGPGYVEAFNLNKTLMCWSCIPAHLTQSFDDKWQVELA